MSPSPQLSIVTGQVPIEMIPAVLHRNSHSRAPHNPLGPISTAAAAHVCFASSNLGVLEMARQPGTVLTDIFPTHTLFDSGHVIPSNQPGLGVTLDESVLAKYHMNQCCSATHCAFKFSPIHTKIHRWLGYTLSWCCFPVHLR